MFNFWKIADLKDEIFHLNKRIESRDIQIERLQAELNKMSLEKADSIKKDVETSEFEIDWKNMDAFSVERMGDNSCAYTVIGYYLTDEHNIKHVHEWKFYCSQEQHNKLAKEFKDGVTKANNSSVRERSGPRRKRK